MRSGKGASHGEEEDAGQGGEDGEDRQGGGQEGDEGGRGQAHLQSRALEGRGEGLEIRGRPRLRRARRGGGAPRLGGSPPDVVGGGGTGPDRLPRGVGYRG